MSFLFQILTYNDTENMQITSSIDVLSMACFDFFFQFFYHLIISELFKRHRQREEKRENFFLAMDHQSRMLQNSRIRRFE